MNLPFRIRAGCAFLILCALYMIIIANLYILQIQQHEFFVTLGQQQYQVSVTTYPQRALVYDRVGNPLAMNEHRLAAFILPQSVHKKEELERFLRNHFPQALARWQSNPKARFLYIKRKLNKAQQTLIEHSGLSDIKILREPHRFYPISCAGHIVGITDIDNTGLFGVELLCNTQLSGVPTNYILEKDARLGYFYFTKSITQAGGQGTEVRLTIDADLQFIFNDLLVETVKKFGAKEGAALVMDPCSGEVIAMAQYPSFDPNNTESLNIADTKNKCITETYELGSVMKVFTALAALQERVVTPDELIDCEHTKSTYLQGIKVNTVHPQGIIPFSEVIEMSNNIGIAKVAQRLGSRLYHHYTRLGFGSKAMDCWPGEHKGFVNPPTNWSKQSLISMSFGYEIMASLLQLATAFSIIACGSPGKPHIVMQHNRVHECAQENRLYDQYAINIIREILEKTVQQGTARKARLQGYKVMAKTGTTNLLIDGVYQSDHNAYTCSGIIEKEAYKRVIVVFVKDAAHKDLYAATVAVPLFEKIAEHLLIHDKVI
jgi:cell division protein FtsI (penicillin-binding protein 3)